MWRVVNSGIASAAVNMATDEAIMEAHGKELVPPTLRFYGWEPAAISLGYFQKAEVEVDLTECRKLGIDVVRRITGGRAVLHDRELTYSIVVREDYPGIPATITGSYRYFCTGLIAGLQKLGIAAQMHIPGEAYSRTAVSKAVSAACFDAPARYEVMFENRKLIGSAQVRKNGLILQHGSVLIGFRPEAVTQLLRFSSPEYREKATRNLRKRAVSLEEILARKVSLEEVTQAMSKGFEEALHINLVSGRLTEQEQALSLELAAEKYGKDFWNAVR